MPTNAHNLDPIERLMREASEAHQAGVFSRTPVDEAALAAPARTSWFARHKHALIGLPAAASIAFVAFLGIFPDQKDPPVALEELHSCFTGPVRASIGLECGVYDYDNDGDVDLFDFRTFQLSEVQGSSR
jgi:hypothetical protein